MQFSPIVSALHSQRFYTLRHGLGVDFSTGRTILRPHSTARVVYYDPSGSNTGPTTQNGITTYWRNTWSDAKLIARSGDSGDWILCKGGTTLTHVPGDLRVSGGGFGAMNGINAQYPAVWGTYDPADPYNWAKCNVLPVTFEPASTGSIASFIAGVLVDQHDVAFVAWNMVAPADTCGVAPFHNNSVTRFLFERVVTEHMQVSAGGQASYVAGMAASTTKSVDLTFRHCGGLFGNDMTSGRYSNLYVHNSTGTRIEYCWYHHGGWNATHTRSTPEWTDPAWANPPGSGPDTFKHNIYFTAWNENLTIVQSGNSWDASLSKFHGHNAVVDGWADIRCPIGMIVGDGSDHDIAWPSGQFATVRNHLQVFSDDINYTNAVTFGWGPSLASVTSGSEYIGGVIRTRNNPGGSGNAKGFTAARSDGLSCVARWRQSLALDWAAESFNGPPTSGSGGTTTNTIEHCLTHASQGGSNQVASTTLAARGLSASKTMLTFFDAHGVSYTGSTDMEREDSGCRYMARNPGTRWFPLLARHFRAELFR